MNNEKANNEERETERERNLTIIGEKREKKVKNEEKRKKNLTKKVRKLKIKKNGMHGK